MYANVAIDAGAPQDLVTVPQTAITYNPYGATVFVVDQSGGAQSGAPKAIAKQRFVEVGPTRGDQVAVTKGLAGGDVVVTAGQLKLRNGEVQFRWIVLFHIRPDEKNTMIDSAFDNLIKADVFLRFAQLINPQPTEPLPPHAIH